MLGHVVRNDIQAAHLSLKLDHLGTFCLRLAFQPTPKAGNWRQGHELLDRWEIRLQLLHHLLNEEVAEGDILKAWLAVANAIERSSGKFRWVDIVVSGVIQYRIDRARNLVA